MQISDYKEGAKSSLGNISENKSLIIELGNHGCTDACRDMRDC